MTKAELVAIREIWEERVAKFRASGQSAPQWCAEQHLAVRQLHYWRHKLAPVSDMPSSPQWVAVTTGETSPTSPEHGVTLQVGRVMITVTPGFHAGLLQDVIRTLQSGC